MAGILKRKKWILSAVMMTAAAGMILYLTSDVDGRRAIVAPGDLPAIEVDELFAADTAKEGI